MSGIKSLRASSGQRPELPRAPFQFGLRDVLIWVTALCPVLTVAVKWGPVEGYLVGIATAMFGLWFYRGKTDSALLAYLLFIYLALLLVVVLWVNEFKATYYRPHTPTAAGEREP